MKISKEDKEISLGLLENLVINLKGMKTRDDYIDEWNGSYEYGSIIHSFADQWKYNNVEVQMRVKIIFKNQPEYIQLPYRLPAFCGHDASGLGGAKETKKEITVDDKLFVYSSESGGCKECNEEENSRRFLEAKEYLNNQTEK